MNQELINGFMTKVQALDVNEVAYQCYRRDFPDVEVLRTMLDVKRFDIWQTVNGIMVRRKE